MILGRQTVTTIELDAARDRWKEREAQYGPAHGMTLLAWYVYLGVATARIQQDKQRVACGGAR